MIQIYDEDIFARKSKIMNKKLKNNTKLQNNETNKVINSRRKYNESKKKEKKLT